MNWRGKAIGGSIGSFFGPLGALAGATAGHFLVDRKNAGAAERHSLRLVALAAGALHELAVAQGLAFVPGELFSASGMYRNCLRLNCGNPHTPEIEDAVRRLGQLISAV